MKDGDGNDWDRPSERRVFGEGQREVIKLEIGLGTLTRLTLNTVDLPYID